MYTLKFFHIYLFIVYMCESDNWQESVLLFHHVGLESWGVGARALTEATWPAPARLLSRIHCTFKNNYVSGSRFFLLPLLNIILEEHKYTREKLEANWKEKGKTYVCVLYTYILKKIKENQLKNSKKKVQDKVDEYETEIGIFQIYKYTQLQDVLEITPF